MRLVLFSNYLNHHQVPVADEFYRLLGGDFRFVATLPRNKIDLKGGIDYSTRPYCVLSSEDSRKCVEALHLAINADVCVFGACSQYYAVARAKHNPQGLSFEMGERWLKNGCLTIGSRVFRRWLLNYYLYFRKANFYKLCCSSFVSNDDERMHAYHGRHYKWGYFSNVNLYNKFPKESISPPETHKASETENIVRLMWCARFLKLKQPELPVLLAARLKEEGYSFVLDYYGDGKELIPTMQRAERLGLLDRVEFHGAVSNEQVLEAMRQHDIFLFTSNRLEGWGVVANESMATGCVLVASDAIGSTHYLVKNKETGIIFRSCDIDSLFEQVKYLLDTPSMRRQISKAGQESVLRLWSPANAAKSLLELIDDLQAGRESTIVEGPCSKA